MKFSISVEVGRHSSCKGFAILEALIAFIVLAVGLLALLSFNSATMRNNADAKIREQAINLAQAKIEELRSFYDLDNFDAEMVDNDGSGADKGMGAYSGIDSPATFTRAWTVDLSSNPAVLNVSVAWVDSGNQPQKVELATQILRDDIPRAAADLVVALSGSGGSDGQGDWGDDGGTTAGPRQVVETWDRTDPIFDGVDIPDSYTDDVISLFRVYIHGPVQIRGNSEITGGAVTDADIKAVLDQVNVGYTAQCYWDLSDIPGFLTAWYAEQGEEPPVLEVQDEYYYCEVYYLSFQDGWAGTITYEARLQNGNPAYYCLPVGAQAEAVDGFYNKSFEQVVYSQTLLLRVSNNQTSCDL